MKRTILIILGCILLRTAFSQSFGPNQIIVQTDIDSPTCVFSIDIDGDEDNDVLLASWGDDKIAWYENLGNGNFGSQQIITTNAICAKCVYSIDLDGDGDNDVLSASYNDIAWYKNNTISGFFENSVEDNNIIIFPNPANKTVNILCEKNYIIEICDVSGNVLITSEKTSIDISNLSKGIYIVLIKNKEGILKKTDKLIVD